MQTDRLVNTSRLRLRVPDEDDEDEAIRAHRELAAEDFEFLLGLDAGMSWAGYVQRLEEKRQGINLAPGRVPATFLLAEVDGQLVGRVSIRHQLNDFLRRVGGHIGYGVRPQFRRRGYATGIFRQSLQTAAELGIGPALVTCDDDNEASVRVIESGGGVLEGTVAGQNGAAGKRRYWVPTGVVR